MSRRQRLEDLHALLGSGGAGRNEASAKDKAKGAKLDFGVPQIDETLPWQGLAAGNHEVCPGGADLPHEAAAVQLAACLLARGRGPVVWALPRLTLFPPALAEAGLDPDRVLFVEAGRDEDVLAASEEALRHGGLAGVVCDAGKVTLTASRRLQLAGEAGGTVCLALRRWRRGQPPAEGTACATRWQVTAHGSADGSGLPRAAWALDLTRCRGGRPARWDVALEPAHEPAESGGAPLRLRLADAVASGQADAPGRRAA